MKLRFSSPVMRLPSFNPESLPLVTFLKLWLIQMVRIWVLASLEISRARLFWLIIFYLHLASHFFYIMLSDFFFTPISFFFMSGLQPEGRAKARKYISISDKWKELGAHNLGVNFYYDKIIIRKACKSKKMNLWFW